MLAKSVLIETLACFGQRPGGDQRLLAIVWLVRSRVLLLLPRSFGGGGRHAQSRCKSNLPPVQLTTCKCSHHPGRRHREARAHHDNNQKESEQRGRDIIATRHHSKSSLCLRFFAETAVAVEISAAAQLEAIEHCLLGRIWKHGNGRPAHNFVRRTAARPLFALSISRHGIIEQLVTSSSNCLPASRSHKQLRPCLLFLLWR